MAIATKHGQEDEDSDDNEDDDDSDPHMELIYSILNEFLGQITFDSPEAEVMLTTALEDESCLTPSMHQRLLEVFSSIFFHHPKGLQDRSV